MQITAPHRSRRSVVIAAMAMLAGAHVRGQGSEAKAKADGNAAQPVAEYGIELLGVRLSGEDFLIDLRYRVKDTAKAQVLLERKVQPVLVNEVSGDRFYVPQVPKVGALRQSATSKQPAQLDKVYFMLFANPDRKLRAGDKVTLYAGDSTVTGLVVQ